MEYDCNSRLAHAYRLRSAGLVVLLPEDAEFAVSQQSYWSLEAQLSPSCIVRPRNAQEVSIAVRTFATDKCAFAVRSGGHTPWAGASNVTGGFTLDLGLMSSTRFNEKDTTANIGPGARWKDVYAELDKYGRMVAGGREGHVGVGGLILGGGNTFLTARRGFACDTLLECEVVLANGSIVTANEKQNTDLFWALKGGSNNFGIVTSFMMKTFEGGNCWGGVTIYPRQTSWCTIQNLTDFTDKLHTMPDSNVLCFFAYTGTSTIPRHAETPLGLAADSSTPQIKDVVVGVVTLQVDGNEHSPAYESWRGLPSILSTCKATTMSEYISLPEHSMPPGYFNIFFTRTFMNDPRIVSHAVELHEDLAAEFKVEIPDGDFWTQCLFQPLPTLYGASSVAAGGNAMGLERQEVNGLLFVAVAMVRTASQYAWAYPKIMGWVDALKAFAGRTVEGGNLEWVYLNYADVTQDPLGSYGEGNLERLSAVAAKYDPEQVFQKLCPGGFKISEAQSKDTKP